MRRHSSDSDKDRLAIVPYQRTDDEFDPVRHARLCFGLGPQNYTMPNPERYQTVRNSGVQPARVYSQEDIDRFTSIFKDYFHGLTGFQLQNFKLTQSTQKYVSMLEFARGRDRILSTLFERRPKIWDLHAGSGADSFAFMMDLDPVEIILCQRSVPDDERHGTENMQASEREYRTMCENVKDFLKSTSLDALLDVAGEHNALPEGPATRRMHVKCKHLLAENFIMSSPNKEVDIIYLDPSWDDDRDSGGHTAGGAEMAPEQLFDQLRRLIWDPIKRQNIKVGCYVIKTRWNWKKIEQYMEDVNTEFVAKFSVRTHPFRPDERGLQPDEYGGVRGVYHYMILTHKEYKTIELENSQMYWDIVRNNVPVWVKRSTCVGIIKPLYSDHAKFPVYTETEPANSRGYFKINAHGRRRREKTEGPRVPGEHASYDSQRFEPGQYYEPVVQPEEAPVRYYEPPVPQPYYSSPNYYGSLPEETDARLKAAASASRRPR